MTLTTKTLAATAIRYRNVEVAAAWLQAAFGFELRAKILDDAGGVGLVQLTWGNHLFLVLPVGGSELDALMRQPDEIGGLETQGCYLVVKDVEQHHNRAQTAGADIVSPVRAFDRGGHGYTCRDLEGHLWSFGSYDPLSEPSVGPSVALWKRIITPVSIAALSALVLIVGGLVLGHALASFGMSRDPLLSQLKLANEKADKAIELAAQSKADVAKERAAKRWIGLDSQRARQQLALERRAREGAEKSLHQSEMKNAAERSARTAAEEAAGNANAAAIRERASKDTADRAAAAARNDLTLATAAKKKAERSAKDAAEQGALERVAREDAERRTKEVLEKLKQAQVPAANRAKPADQPAKKATNAPGAAASKQALPPLVP